MKWSPFILLLVFVLVVAPCKAQQPTHSAKPVTTDRFWLATNGAFLVEGELLYAGKNEDDSPVLKCVSASDTMFYFVLRDSLLERISSAVETRLRHRFKNAQTSLTDDRFKVRVSDDAPYVTRISNGADEFVFFTHGDQEPPKISVISDDFNLAFATLPPDPSPEAVLRLFGVEHLAGQAGMQDGRLVFVGESSIAAAREGSETLFLGGPEYLFIFDRGVLTEMAFARMLGLTGSYLKSGRINRALMAES